MHSMKSSGSFDPERGSPQTAVHLVTLLEDLPVTETLETVAELQAADLRPGAVIVNRVRPQWLPERSVAAAADGRVDAARIRSGSTAPESW